MNQKTIYEIKDFANGNNNNRLQGLRLRALHRLIQYKGVEVETSEDPKLIGVKILEFSKGEHIGIIHTPIKLNSFYPCKLQTIILTNL